MTLSTLACSVLLTCKCRLRINLRELSCVSSLHCTSGSESLSYAEEEADDIRGRRVARRRKRARPRKSGKWCVGRGRSLGWIGWLIVCARSSESEVSSWACCVLSSKSGLCISNCCPLPPSALPPTLLLSLIPVNPCGLVVPLPLKMSYFVAVHSAGVSLAPSDSLHSTDPPTRPHADRA